RARTPTHTPAAAPHSMVKATTVSGSSSYTSTSYRYSTVSSGTSTAAATRAKGYSLAKASAITTITPRPNAARNVAMDALGRCGMSVVYLAEHVPLRRKVALKVLAPELAGDQAFRTRFVRESQVAASIDHPNIIPIYAAGEVEGVLYISMRYVDGTDLKRR